MRLTLTEFVTLDGVCQGPGGPTEDPRDGFTQGGWLVPFFDEELGQFMSGVFDEVDAFVLGRRTYEIFAGSWPNFPDPDDPIASRLNTLPKYVASRTLTRADWNNSTVLGGDVVAEVAKLKEQPGRELQIHGSGALAQTLFDAGLIDTIRLIVFPVVLGTGLRLFAEGRTPAKFRLSAVRSTPAGVTVQTLDLAGAPEYGTVDF
ncbi:dihydrofolate reductase family protein [Phytohabitans rumicis]|nr:dihydrofolate reductase family protein [Phytohabitans rumicis]